MFLVRAKYSDELARACISPVLVEARGPRAPGLRPATGLSGCPGRVRQKRLSRLSDPWPSPKLPAGRALRYTGESLPEDEDRSCLLAYPALFCRVCLDLNSGDKIRGEKVDEYPELRSQMPARRP
jgi:hypothetical protein